MTGQEPRLRHMRTELLSLWEELTEDDLDRTDGDTEQLVALIKERTAETTGESTESIEYRLRELLEHEALVSPAGDGRSVRENGSA